MSTAPTGKLLPFGIVLAYSTNGGGAYTDLAELKMTKPPNRKRDFADVTVLDSPDFHKEYRGSWRDCDSLEAEIFYTAARRATLEGFYEDDDVQYWRLTFPLLDGETTPFKIIMQGQIEELGFSEAVAGANDAFSCPIKIKKTTNTGYNEVAPT